MDQEKAQNTFDTKWSAEQIEAINDAVKGRAVEGLEIGDRGDHQFVLILFADGLQLRIECGHLEAVDPIEPQHI